MKKLLVFVVALTGLAFTADRVKVKGNEALFKAVITNTNVASVIAANERIVSDIFFDVSELPLAYSRAADTLGYAWLRCADSAGTDSIGGVLTWQGNPRPDGLDADWEQIDSVTITAGTGTTYLQTGKLVLTAKHYGAIRFVLRNQWGTAAAKSSCFAYFNRKINLNY